MAEPCEDHPDGAAEADKGRADGPGDEAHLQARGGLVVHDEEDAEEGRSQPRDELQGREPVEEDAHRRVVHPDQQVDGED